MDSRDVSRALRATIRPLLRQHGFSRFTERSAWRYTPDSIQVVNLRWSPASRGRVVGDSPVSFAVKLGLYYPDVPEDPAMLPIRERRGWPAPEEYRCHLRAHLKRSYRQPGNPYPDVWSIDVDGRTLPRALEDVARSLDQDALPWFNKYGVIANAIQLLKKPGGFEDGAWASGANPSPQRSYVIGYLAWSLGDLETATAYLNDARNRFGALAGSPVSADRFGLTAQRLAEDCLRIAAGQPLHASDAGS